MKDLVSVIVPIYNVERYLSECIDSLINQTYTNIEIILVDDESPDNCPSMCDTYRVQNNNVKVIHQANKGLPGARNAGLAVASGKWILFVDGDDWLALDGIEKLMSHAESGLDIIIFNPNYVNEYNEALLLDKECNYYILGNEDRVKLLKDVIDPLKTRSYVNKKSKMPAWSKLYRKDFLDDNKIKFYEHVKIHEDIPFSIDVLLKAKNIVYLDADIYQYRQTIGSIMNSYRENYDAEMKCLIEQVRAVLKENDILELYENEYNNRLMACLINLVIRKYSNKENERLYKDRKNDFFRMTEMEPYSLMLKSIDIKEYDLKKKIAAFLVKKKLFFLLDITIRWRL